MASHYTLHTQELRAKEIDVLFVCGVVSRAENIKGKIVFFSLLFLYLGLEKRKSDGILAVRQRSSGRKKRGKIRNVREKAT